MGFLEEELKKRFSDRSESGLVDAEGIWAEVSQSLDAAQGNRPAGYARWAKIGGLALLLGGLGYYFLRSENEAFSSAKTAFKTEVDQSEYFDSRNETEITDRGSVGIANDDSKGNSDKDVQNNGEQLRGDNSRIIDTEELQESKSEIARQKTAEKGADPSLREVEAQGESSNEDQSSTEATWSQDGPVGIEEINRNDRAEDTAPSSKMNGFDRSSDLGSNIGGADVASQVVAVLNADDSRIDAKRAKQDEQAQSELGKLDPLGLTALDGSRGSSASFLEHVPLSLKSSEEPKYYSKKNFGPSELAFSLGADILVLDHEQNGSVLNLNGLTSNIPGYSASVLGTWMIDNGLRLSIGLEYAKLRSKFNIESEREIPYLDEDRLISYELDETTGDTLNPVYQDTWMTAIETRTIIHHNEFDLLSIPVRVGYEHNFGKLGLGLDVGVSYGFFLNQTGRSIDAEGSIAEFDMNGGTDVPFSSSLLMYSISPMIDYQLTDALSLRISPSIKFLPKSDSEFHGVDQKGRIWRLSGGIVYRLK